MLPSPAACARSEAWIAPYAGDGGSSRLSTFASALKFGSTTLASGASATWLSSW
jgi:hypothetical protein